MRAFLAVLFAPALMGFLTACGGGGSAPPQPAPTPVATSSPAPNPPQTASVDLTQDKLLSDAELRTSALATEPTVQPAFRDWVAQNAQPIRSITFDQDFSDLQFLKDVVGTREVVQLGESSHGSREFNHMKVRLIKFLHQEMGFSRVAFESGFFEGFHVDQNRSQFTAAQMQNFTFGVWTTNEVLELFRYAETTQGSSNPLRFSGFDSQTSSAYYNDIFPFITNLPETAVLTPGLKSSISQNLRRYQSVQSEFGNSECFSNRSAACNGVIVDGRAAQASLDQNLANLGSVETQSDENMKALAIALLAASRQIDNLTAVYEENDSGDVRDASMAEIFNLVRTNLYPDEKTIIWAHNRHIALEQSDTVPVDTTLFYPDVSMGFHLREQLQNDLLTIGLYMLRGESAGNDRSTTPVRPLLNDSLEAIAYSARMGALYLNVSADQERTSGNAFAFERISAFYWGGQFGTYTIIPSDQYDGVIVIDSSSLPSYRQ